MSASRSSSPHRTYGACCASSVLEDIDKDLKGLGETWGPFLMPTVRSVQPRQAPTPSLAPTVPRSKKLPHSACVRDCEGICQRRALRSMRWRLSDWYLGAGGSRWVSLGDSGLV